MGKNRLPESLYGSAKYAQYRGWRRVLRPVVTGVGAGRVRFQFKSPREQAPGPRGSPQAPQAPVEGAAEAEPFVETANTESWGSSRVPWHFGQSTFCLP